MKKEKKGPVSTQHSLVKKERRNVLLKASVGASLVVWHKPIVNQIVLPAHAQTSVVCPEVTTGNVLFSPVSGVPAGEPERCSVEFEVLSADAFTDLEVTNITNSTLNTFASVTYSGFGLATSVTGPRVIWQGQSTDAPFCSAVSPINDVTFTITATCTGGQPFTQDISLTDIING